MRVSYAFIAYNAQAATGPPQREARLSLYREGRTVYTTPLVLPAPRAESKQIVVSARMSALPTNTPT